MKKTLTYYMEEMHKDTLKDKIEKRIRECRKYGSHDPHEGGKLEAFREVLEMIENESNL